MKPIDAYQQFFELFPKSKFFKFGLQNIITVEKDRAHEEWNKLKNRIAKDTGVLFIRSSGINRCNNSLLSRMYKDVLDITVKYDAIGNSEPTKVLTNLTGYTKNKDIFNYQVAHVFGRTKNVYCFTAPWNLVFIPKIIDPLTGHEAKGDYVGEFQKLFQQKIYDVFKTEITDYNRLMKKWLPKIEKWIEKTVPAKKQKNIIGNFQPIKTAK